MSKTETTCLDLIIELSSKNKEIQKFRFISFDDYEKFQMRTGLNDEIDPVIAMCRDLHSKLKLPFWDSFNLSLFDRNLTSFDFLNLVKFHNNPSQIFVTESSLVKNYLAEIDNNSLLTINSKVGLKNEKDKHIPLLDFYIPVSNYNEKICVEIIKCLGLSGHLLNSGKSYHFYGNNLLDDEEFIYLLSQALFFSPIIDRAWITHQLIERSACLRISRKYSRLPFIVAEI